MSNILLNNVLAQNNIVFIQNGFKSYSKNEIVLNDFSMSISSGSLYALIGSSGCGKTTVINCILGLMKLDSGHISVFGQIPATNQSRIGYMPQELSLYSNLTIWETLKYFGRLKQVEDLEMNIQFVKKLLTFHNTSILLKSTLIGNLSGGEQKQVSLAVALINRPMFVLLDEPTSGLDPLLRERIWTFLVNLVEMQKVTILLTTHYSDEVRKANMVGIIRNGKLITEEPPSKLLERYNTQSLDEVILQIYKQPEMIKNIRNLLVAKENIKIAVKHKISFQRIKALIWKNWRTGLRQKGLFLFILIMPAIITLITCTTYRNGPKNIPLGIVNMDDFDGQNTCSDIQEDKSFILECVGEPLSCRFLEELFPKFPGFSNENLISGRVFDSLESAQKAVTNGKTWGTLWFPRKFTKSLTYRLLSGGMIAWTYNSNEIWNSSQIYLQMDQTNQLIYSAIVTELHSIFERFFEKLSKDCGLNENLGEYPLQYGKPLVGSSKLGIIDYVAPGFTFGWIFFFPLISTSVRLIMEKKQGTFIRSLTSGIQIWEIFLANFVTELGVILLQSISVLYILVYVFNVGNTSEVYFSIEIFLSWVIFMMGGVSGLCCGFLLGLLCSQEIEAAMLSIAIFFPNAFVSGIVWPVEGMPLVLRWISPFLPFTLPNESLRSLLNREWEITHPGVWPGLLVAFVYIMLYLILIEICIKKANLK